MEFRILGPLEVRSQSGVVALGGIKPRALLAVLILRANESVHAERLALELWGEDAPASAVKTVQVYVSRLRKVLGDPEALVTTPAGYRLRVRPNELDAERFGRLVEDGRAALATGQAEHAAAVLREALVLWRGPPLADLAFEPFAQTEIARLEEQRLAAIEERVEADLAVGQHSALVAELRQLVSDNPTRERVVAQLMLALYRCGRQDEALKVFRDARRVLLTEIGVEPGPQLRELHEAILRQDVALLPATETAPELPPEMDASTAPPLAGRDDEFAWLRLRWERARDHFGGLVTIVGERGVGKTRLASELAGAAHRRGDTVLYTSGRDAPGSLHAALRRIRDPARPTLLVVDNYDEADAERLGELDDATRELNGLPVLVVVCGQDARASEHLHADGVLTLEPLGAVAVGAIARQYASARAPDEVPSEWLLEASGGIARRVHEVASQWARRDAARRVNAVAAKAQAERSQLRSIHDELTGDLADLQHARERILPRRDEATCVVCPFKGLASYEVTDAEYFFGRERLVRELVARLVGSPLLGIVGPSGSGKSSVLRAGLLPELGSGVLPGSEKWVQLLMRPGAHPLADLAATLEVVESEERVLLAIDQFEETFTACDDEEERQRFVAEIVRAAEDPSGRYVVVLALRADFYGRCATYPGLSELLADNNVLVGSMRREELRAAIERPAQRAGLRVEHELVEALVADVEGEPGGLPLLSTALLELWQRRDGRRLQYATYERTGGVRGAVARLADDAYGQLDEAQQTVVRSVLMRLIGEGAEGTVERRRVALSELEIERDENVARVVALLTDRRLLTISAGTVELAHEALLREWPRLRAWIDEDRDGLRIHRRLTSASEEWDSLGHDEEALYQGARLAEAQDWRTRSTAGLAAVERRFLDEAEARQRRQRAARRRNIRVAFAGLTVALTAIAVVALVALSQRHEAQQQRDIAVSRQLAADSADTLAADPQLSLMLAQRAVASAPTAQAVSALRQAVRGFRGLAVVQASRGRVNGVDLSPDGHRAVSASDDGAVRVWNLDDGRALMTARAHRGAAWAAAFDPKNGRWVASSGSDGAVILTDLAMRRSRVLISRPGTTALSLAVSRDGEYLASGFSDGSVRIARTDGAGAVRELRGHRGRVGGVAFSKDGRRLASAGKDGTVRIWDLVGADAPVVTRADPLELVSVSISDRQVIAATAHDGEIRFWSLNGRREGRVRADDQAIYVARFSPDGRRIVAVGEDGAVRVLDAAARQVIATMRGHSNPAVDATFSARGDQVISAGADGTVWTWDIPTTRVIRARVVTASFSPSGTHIVGGQKDGTVGIWNAASGLREGTLLGQSDISVPRFSHDGRHVISASLDGTVRIWKIAGATTEHVFKDHHGPVYAADLDRHAGRVASAGPDGRIVIRSLAGTRPEVVKVFEHPHRAAVYGIAFSSSGQLISAGDDGTARIWDPTRSSRAITVLTGHRGPVIAAQFSPNNRFLVTAGADGTVRVWKRDGRPQIVLRGHDGAVLSAAFDPSGDRIVSSGQDGSVRVWDVRTSDALVTLHNHRGEASSASFSPTGSDVLSVGADGIVWISACEACGSLDSVLLLARVRAQRQLSATEQQRYLGNPH